MSSAEPHPTGTFGSSDPDRGMRGDNADVAVPLDSLFIDAEALGQLRRLVPGRAGPRLALRLAARPRVVAKRAKSRRAGYRDGRSLTELFAWLRPRYLIWNYWVDTYVLGKTPPAFDMLYWNANTTQLTAGLHADFLRLAVDNARVEGTATALGRGEPGQDGRRLLCPWVSCSPSAQLLGMTSSTTRSGSSPGHRAKRAAYDGISCPGWSNTAAKNARPPPRPATRSIHRSSQFPEHTSSPREIGGVHAHGYERRR